MIRRLADTTFRRLVLVLSAAILMTPCTLHSAAAEDFRDEANAPPRVVRDVAVYLLSAYGTQLNERGLFTSTLPAYTLSRRPTASRDDSNNPTPGGVITFAGPPEKDVDVLLEFDNGRFLTHWPPGRMRSKRLLWAGIDLQTESGETEPASMPQQHWLAPLRQTERLFAVGNKHSERFLLYDAELPYAPHVTLDAAENGYAVTNTGKYPIHDVTIYRPAADRTWEVASLLQLDAAPASSEDAADQQAKADEGKPDVAKPGTPVAETAAEVAAAPAAVPAAVAQPPVAVAEASSPANPPQQESDKKAAPPPAGVTAIAGAAGTMSAEEALDAWRKSLAALNLEPPEIDFVVSILRQQALRSDSAMLVYRLDDAHLEKLLPLEVTPYPDRLFRVALVVVQDADPQLQSRIENLVARLGDNEWRQREAAQKDLAEMGLAAKPKLEEALKNEDAEIVFRAEQLLEQLKPSP